MYHFCCAPEAAKVEGLQTQGVYLDGPYLLVLLLVGVKYGRVYYGYMQIPDEGLILRAHGLDCRLEVHR